MLKLFLKNELRFVICILLCSIVNIYLEMYDLLEKAVIWLRIFKVIMISKILTISPLQHLSLPNWRNYTGKNRYGGALIHYKFRKILDLKQWQLSCFWVTFIRKNLSFLIFCKAKTGLDFKFLGLNVLKQI